ncbi:hypothetical protein Tco_0677879 [Tanacetum coccineum]|uniref:Reverse transcriptase domain-containing protein n=1 Tax=Tanacetum coccineum TaxID=301880 RepID=A0ABQ4XDF4_9ASTR
MSGPAELNLSPPMSAVRNTVGKGNEQISKNLNRTASDAALQEYCDKHYRYLLPITAEKVHKEKMQQEKQKEVKVRLNFERCSRRNSKVQEVSQHSESRILNVRGEHGRGRSRQDIGREEKEEEIEEYSIGWEIKERVCPHTQKAVTIVTAREEWNPFPENVTMKKHIHRGHKCSPRVKIAEGDTGSQK